MNFVKTSFYSGIGTAVNIVVRLVTNKIIAVYLGTNGMFLLGQLRDFLKFTTVFSNLGTTNGTIKYVSDHKEDIGRLKQYLITGFNIHLICSVIVGVLTFLFNKQLSVYLFDDSQYSTYLNVLALSLVTLSLHTFFMSVLNGMKKIKLYVIINIISALISAVVLVLLVLYFDTIGALYAFAVNQILILLISYLLISYYRPFKLRQLFGRINKSAFTNLSKFSIMAIAGPLCTIAATFFVRTFLSDTFDKDHAGSWEGMWRISAMYLLFLTTTFKFYLLPTFSSISGIALKREVFKVWRFIVPIILLITITIYVLKDIVIVTLLDDQFMLISTLMGFHLIGDVIRINGWVLGNILIAKAKTKAFVFFQIEWAVVFGVLTFVLVQSYGFLGVSMAYFGAYLIHFILMNIYFRKLLWL